MENEKRYIGIGKVAWGYLFIYFNLKINSVSLLPAFVGYVLFLSAIRNLKEEERELESLRPFGAILTLWHCLLWLVSFGGSSLDGMWLVVNILVGMVNVYFHFRFLTNLATIAEKHQPEGYTLDAELLRYRTIQTVLLTLLLVIGHVSPWLGNLGAVVSVLAVIVYLIVGIALMKVLFELRQCLREAEAES